MYEQNYFRRNHSRFKPLSSTCSSWRKFCCFFEANQPIAQITSAQSESILDAFDKFREQLNSEAIDLDSDEIFAHVRDPSPTPEKPCW